MMSSAPSTQSKSPALKVVLILVVVAVAAGLYFQSMRASKGAQRVTFAVQRGDLRVTVLEGGNVEAQESQEIKSEIRGHTGAKILSIIEEGYLVTQEDIDNGLILVELDPSALEDQLVNQEIAVQTAEAQYIESRAQFDIQVTQNQRNISEASLAVKFARMDFEKFLGANSVRDIEELLDLTERFKENTSPKIEEKIVDQPKRVRPEGAGRRGGDPREGGAAGRGRPGGAGGERRGMDPARLKQMIADNGGELPSFIKDRLGDMGMTEEQFMAQINGGDAGGAQRPPEPQAPQETSPTEVRIILDEGYLRLRDAIDFSKYADDTTLEDGEAKQTLSNLKADELVAIEEARLAESRLEGQERLFESAFITQNELELQMVQEQKAKIRVETTRMETELYIKYTFPKQAEFLFFGYEDALMGLVRERKESEAETAEADARLKSSERKFNLQRDEFENLKDQLEKCIIRAERPGLVVYGSSSGSSPWRRSSEEPIAEGSTVRERQRIITIPDMNHMGVKVNIHESNVKKVSVGQMVSVEMDAFPGRILEGEVVKVAVLADSANAFMNPDLKVYPTDIRIDGTHDWLRPGMSAQIEILIEKLTDVLYVPIQAVTYEGDKNICYVLKNGNTVKRIVTPGSFTEAFIEIKDGLEEGEEVLLLAPDSTTIDDIEEPAETEAAA
ncbi:MAG: efflux RND transporter periplasmic adaptor subunit [Candidatus Hydrogenedentota bacterium]